jgi:DnaJ-class molecular chaperone
MDYYQILGVSETAGQDEIKKAYKKLAMKNHPDRGGDTQKFQEISQAYDTLGDTNKRAQYDAERQGFGNPFNMSGGFADFGEMFGFRFGPGFGPQQRSQRRNRDLTIRLSVTFKQSFTGTQVEAQYKTPSGKTKTVVIDVPAGVQSGQVIRYGGLGDDSIPNIPPGNLNVTVMVETEISWQRRGDELVKLLDITVLEAMTGCTKEIKSLDGTTIPLVLRAGVQHGAEFASGGRGFKNINTGRAGNLVVIINIIIPAITDPDAIEKLTTTYADITKTP